MTIEIVLVIAILGFCVSLYFNMTSSKRAEKECNAREASSLTTVATKVDHISDNVCEIKKDVKDMRVDIGDVRERLRSVESSDKSAHKRIDLLEKIIKPGGSD